MKKISFLLVLVMVFTLIPVGTVVASNEDVTKIQELKNDGLSEEQAIHILKVDRIIKHMEKTGQKLEIIDGKVQIVDPNNLENGISDEDKVFIIHTFEKQIQKQRATKQSIISKEKVKYNIQRAMEENPNRREYRIDYGQDTWVKVKVSTEKIEKISDDKVRTYGYSEQQVDRTDVGTLGKYTTSYELAEFDGVYYSKNWIEQTCTFSNSWKHAHIDSARNGQSAYGAITIANSGKYINVADADYNVDPKQRCDVESQVVFTVSGSVGYTFVGVFSFSVNVGASWTQYAILRTATSGVILKYAGLYI